MAEVTGGYSGSPEDERFTRRGSGAGKFQRPGTPDQIAQAQRMAGDWLAQIMSSLGMGGQTQPKVTGDVNLSSVEPTYGGGGRGSGAGAARVTTGATGGAPLRPGGTQRMQQLMGGLGGLPTGRLGLGAGIIPGVTTGLSELAAGRPVGAAGALAGAGVGGVMGYGAARFIPGPLGKVAQVALPFLGAQFGAGQGAAAAEYGRQKVTGEPTKGKEEEIASQLALQQKLSDLGLDRFRTETVIQTSAIKDLSKFYSDQQYLDLQRNLPLVNQMKNADLVRQQALLASQGNQLARLSILGTAGQLAAGAQGESGATLRTMLTSNPYANAVLR